MLRFIRLAGGGAKLFNIRPTVKLDADINNQLLEAAISQDKIQSTIRQHLINAKIIIEDLEAQHKAKNLKGKL
jgi:outer membrane lipopolysaccharide assembly protein LptE/RlpB